MLQRALTSDRAPYLPLATVFGVVAGIIQLLGLARWVFLVPFLANTYFDTSSTEVTCDTVHVIFQSFNIYAGARVGEHLGYLFTGLWVALIGAVILSSGRFKSWTEWLAFVAATGILAGLLEPLGIDGVSIVNAMGMWSWQFG